jgi:hypothetical protein
MESGKPGADDPAEFSLRLQTYKKTKTANEGFCMSVSRSKNTVYFFLKTGLITKKIMREKIKKMLIFLIITQDYVIYVLLRKKRFITGGLCIK